jgi:catechol-2,3-dioxygenase
MLMHVGHVALQVEDLERSVRHATDTLGLRESHREDSTAFLTSNERHQEMRSGRWPDTPWPTT